MSPTSCLVELASMMPPGGASACKRAARFGVSPTTDSRALPLSDKVAHNDRTGGIPMREASTSPRSAVKPPTADAIASAAERSLRLVLVPFGDRDCEHAIAHEFRQMATYPADLTSHCVPKAA